MKRGLFLLALFLGLGVHLASAQTDRIPIAVMDLDAKGVGLEMGVADVITESVRDEFGKQKDFDLVAREKMAQLAKEKAFQLTGCTDVSCAVEIGKALNVKKMVVGSVGKLGQKYLVFLRVVDVEKENVECSDKGEGEVRVEEIPSLVPSPVRRISACLTGKPVPPETSAVAKPAAGMTFLKVNEQGYREFRNEMDGSEMILIPGGSFLMGSDEHGDEEKPLHKVTLDSFFIDKYEVTVGQFKKFVEATGYLTEIEVMGGAYLKLPVLGLFADKVYEQKANVNWRNPGFSQVVTNPVTCVWWNDASAYASWAGKRLPTEAEWEKAARGADGRAYPWGKAWDPSKCNNGGRNSTDNFDKTAPVGSFPQGASPYGAMDMAGNVWEWCADRWAKNYYQKSPDRNPAGPSTGKDRVLRGGSWEMDSLACRTSGYRGGDYLNNKTYYGKYRGKEYSWQYNYNPAHGFRCVRAVK